jgi:ParB family transcriptional regulator, chromosome partitioning protein
MSSSLRARQLEKVRTQLGGGAGHDRLFGAIGNNLPHLVEARVEDITPNPHQPRGVIDPEGIASLAASIERHGLLQPIVVRRRETGTPYEIVAGERRFRAFQSLGRETIPALMTTGDPEELALIENIQREDLHPLDEASAVGRLMQRHGYTQEAVGRIIGKPRTTVGEIVSINTLPEWLKTEARAHSVTRHILVQLARIDDEGELVAAWEAVKGGASVRALKTRRTMAKGKDESRQAADPIKRTMTAVRRSVRELAKLPIAQIVAQREHREDLLELRRVLDDILAKMEGK